MADTLTVPTPRVWSDLQNAIFFELETSERHIVVRARAGTGKTTTIVEAVKRYQAKFPAKQITVAAFNKSIQEELTRRFIGSSNITVKTLHAIGLACVKSYWPDVKVSFSSDRQDDLAHRACGVSAPDTIKKLVGKLITKAREIKPHATAYAELMDVAFRFECNPDEEWNTCRLCGYARDTHNDVEHNFEGFDVQYVCERAIVGLDLAAEEKPVKTGIDGSDMIFLPLRNRWLRKLTDDVFVDEAQDMTAAQLEIAQGIARGRIAVIGDDKQGIYAFRGADSGALDRLKRELNALELPLNTTYRCAKLIVEQAQRLVPDFQAGSDNPDGEVSYLDREDLTKTATAGDFILSRVNAPLVSIAMSLLRSGKRTRIAGRDIGAGLVGLIRRFKARSVPELLKKIAAWETRELARLDKQFTGKKTSSTYTTRVEGIRDQAEMLGSLTDGAANVDEVQNRITSLFTDDGLGDAGMITCSSVHKAKGLEADRVFLLAATLREDSDEERNITYVAITRAKNRLVYVTERKA